MQIRTTIQKWVPGAELLLGGPTSEAPSTAQPASGPLPDTPPMTRPPIEAEKREGSATQAASADPFAAHLANVRVAEVPQPDQPGGDGPAPTGAPAMASTPGALPKEAWVAGAIELFEVPSKMPFEPLRFQSFEVAKDERPSAEAAFASLYEICEETAFLRWMIEPEGLWAKRVLAIGMFAVPKGLAIAGEIRLKRLSAAAEARQVEKTAEPAREASAAPDAPQEGGEAADVTPIRPPQVPSMGGAAPLTTMDEQASELAA